MLGGKKALLSQGWRRFGLIVVCLAFQLGYGQSNLTTDPNFREACRLLADKRYAPSSEAFQSVWSRLGGPASNDFERGIVASRLLEAWYKNDDAEIIIAWYRANQSFYLPRAGRLWAAYALRDQGYFEEAAKLFGSLIEANGTAQEQSLVLNRVRCLSNLGENRQALKELEAGFPDDMPLAQQLLASQLALRSSQPHRALDYASSLLTEANGDLSVWGAHSARQVKAEALRRTGDEVRSEQELFDIIENAPADADLITAFDQLFEQVSFDGREKLETKLKSWRESPLNLERKITAEYYSIIWSTDLSDAGRIAQLEKFIAAHSGHDLASEAKIRISVLDPQRFAELGTPDDSAEKFADAMEAFRSESYLSAASTFLALSDQLKGEEKNRSLFNSAVCVWSKYNNRHFWARGAKVINDA
ncbi:MAG: hypothetical protein AAF226_11670, partial [Verrucomicrobiota bacterium]